jgi:hypothetical protein
VLTLKKEEFSDNYTTSIIIGSYAGFQLLGIDNTTTSMLLCLNIANILGVQLYFLSTHGCHEVQPLGAGILKLYL